MLSELPCLVWLQTAVVSKPPWSHNPGEDKMYGPMNTCVSMLHAHGYYVTMLCTL